MQPRWSDVIRKGAMRAYVARVVEPEEYAAMTDEQLFAFLQEQIDVNEAAVTGTYEHPENAQYLERLIYVCPECGLSEFESRGDLIQCKKCGFFCRHKPTKELAGVGEEIPFRFVADWYQYQCDFVNRLDLTQYIDTPMYRDEVQFSEVLLYKKKNRLMKKAEMQLFGDRIIVGGQEIPFSSVTGTTVLGRNKLNVYCGDKLWQMKGDKRFNAIKYMNMVYRYKNMNEGDGNGEFLGF